MDLQSSCPPVIWADEQLIVIDKPSGLLSVPGKGDAGADHALGRVQAHWPNARIVHRLDMSTSGLLVFALSGDVQRKLGNAFARRQVRKTYQALVQGRPGDSAGTIELPLIKDWPNRPRQKVDVKRGKYAVTHWKRLDGDPKESPACSRLELTPVTGRSHQLRVHLLALGHPILGDALYAPPETVTASPRLCLHAWRLVLPHPTTGASLWLESPLPF